MPKAQLLKEVATVQVGPPPHRHIGGGAPGGASVERLWVSNSGGDTLTVLDSDTAERVATIRVGRTPEHFIVDDATMLGYVTLAGDDAVAVVDARANTLVRTIPLAPGSRPRFFLPAFERQRLYTLDQGSGTLSEIDTVTHSVVRTLEIGTQPSWGQPHNKSLGKLYVANAGTNHVAVLDEASGEIIARIPVGKRPERSAINRFHGWIMIANVGDNTLSCVDMASDRVAATLPVGVAPLRLTTTNLKNKRDEMWVLNAGSDTAPKGEINVIDATTLQPLKTIRVCDRPSNWVLRARDFHFLVTSAISNAVTLIDVESASVVDELHFTRQPDVTAISNMVFSTTDKLFVANTDDTVTMVVAG